MRFLRNYFDSFYDIIKPAVFFMTKKDPERAHELFVSFLRFLYETNTDRFILKDSLNEHIPSIKISNAAGFNKNAEIPPSTMRYLGFDRVVIGTVTNDSWNGNPRPRITRYPSTESMINWMGLPGEGAEKIAERLSGYKKSLIPLTISIMSTPGKSGDKLIRDLEGTVLCLRDAHNADRFELNISCPNTHSEKGNIDSREEYQKQLVDILSVIEKNIYPQQEIYLKVSPDMDYEAIGEIFSASDKYSLSGFTIANTTRRHDNRYILSNHEKGGASGNAVYDASLEVQKRFLDVMKERNKKMKIIACGGINTTKKIDERIKNGAEELQIYTPIIFSGTKLLREFRKHISYNYS